MKRNLLIFCTLLLVAACKNNSDNDATLVIPEVETDFPANPLEKEGYVLTKNDEFNSSALDQNLWVPNYLRHRVSDAQSAADYMFENGNLVLKIEKNHPTYGSNTEFKASSIQTLDRSNLHKSGSRSIPAKINFVQKYGYFEIRAKVQGGTGNSNAFWLVGQQEAANEAAEIDVMEKPGNVSNVKTFKFNLYNWADPTLPTNQYTLPAVKNPTTTFNIYALEWTSTELKMYLNNVLVKTMTGSPQYPMGVILSLYEGNDWFGDVKKSTEPYPKKFTIDYFRAYQKK